MGLGRLFGFSKNRVSLPKKESLEGWVQCEACKEFLYEEKFDAEFCCCPKCGFHHPISVEERLRLLVDPGTFVEIDPHLSSLDPLGFSDEEGYAAKLKRVQKESETTEAIITGEAHIEGKRVALGVMNYRFMGGSMGSCVGEKIARLIERAEEFSLPLLIFCNSGGARMQESIFSLMQMAKISSCLAQYQKKGGFYISILLHPTMGGVTASFGMLGDLIIAEPKALIGFAGPRVIQQTIGQILPENAQKSEFLLEKGMIDFICSRRRLRATLSQLVQFFGRGEQ